MKQMNKLEGMCTFFYSDKELIIFCAESTDIK